MPELPLIQYIDRVAVRPQAFVRAHLAGGDDTGARRREVIALAARAGGQSAGAIQAARESRVPYDGAAAAVRKQILLTVGVASGGGGSPTLVIILPVAPLLDIQGGGEDVHGVGLAGHVEAVAVAFNRLDVHCAVSVGNCVRADVPRLAGFDRPVVGRIDGVGRKRRGLFVGQPIKTDAGRVAGDALVGKADSQRAIHAQHDAKAAQGGIQSCAGGRHSEGEPRIEDFGRVGVVHQVGKHRVDKLRPCIACRDCCEKVVPLSVEIVLLGERRISRKIQSNFISHSLAPFFTA